MSPASRNCKKKLTESNHLFVQVGTLSLSLVSRKQVVYNLDYLFGSVCPVSTVFSRSSLYFDRLFDINQRGCS